MEPEGLQCPSARCEEGATLLGVVQPDGSVAHLPQPLVVDSRFVELASRGRAPEKRFRFGNSCKESGCRQWRDGRCGVVDDVVSRLHALAEPGRLPRCSLRPQCRWFRQSGAEACAVCRFVVTDLTEEASPRT